VSSRCRRAGQKSRGRGQRALFNSIWQRQADGRWLVVFDKGGPP
jgi:ketosteroid isomerase-like protein